MILTIIVTYNGEEYIEDCINSMQRQTYQTDILVVDNGSADNTCKLIEEGYPQVKLIRNEKNTGFAGANNIGIRYAMEHGYEYVLLLNEDTVSDRFLVQRLLEQADFHTAVIPKIYSNGSLTKVWYAAGGLNFEEGDSINCQEEFMDEVVEVNFMTGCCMLLPTIVFSEIGLLDENYFMYYEDTDLSIRLYEHQVKMLYIPYTYVWHRLQGRIMKPCVAYYGIRNRLYFMKKHSGTFRKRICKVMINEIARNIFCHDIYVRAFRRYRLKGIWDFARGHMGAFKSSVQKQTRRAEKEYQQIEKYRIFYELVCEWMKGFAVGKDITDWIEKRYHTVAIYGMATLGKTVYLHLQKSKNIQVKYGVDKRDGLKIKGLAVYSVEKCPEPVDLIIVTAVMAYTEIKDALKRKLDFGCDVISLIQLIEEMYIEDMTNGKKGI